MATETVNFDSGLCDEHQDGFIAACFTHDVLLCLKCEESHIGACKVKSLEGTLYEKDKGLINVMNVLQKAKRSFTETEKYVQEIKENRQAVIDDINLELKDIIIRLEQSAKLAIKTVESTAEKMESTFNAFLKEGHELETKLKDQLSMKVGLDKLESIIQNFNELVKKADIARSGKSVDASFSVNETLRNTVNHKPFGTVIFLEVECYEDVKPHTKPNRTQTTKNKNSGGDVVPPNLDPDEERASDSDVYYEGQFGIETPPMSADSKAEKDRLYRSSERIIEGKSPRLDGTLKPKMFDGTLKPKMFDGTLKPKMIASFAKFKQIFKKTDREVESSTFFSDETDCSEITTTSPLPPESKTVVVSTALGQEKPVSYSWTADFNDGILYYSHTEKQLVLTDADRTLKCSDNIQDEPLVILKVSKERVAIVCILQKYGSCVLRCYDVHEREIRLYYSVKLPDEFSQQFIGAWYDTVDDRFAFACNGKLFILNADGAIKSEHKLAKSVDEPVEAERKSSDAIPVKDGGERDIPEATYDFRNQLLFVPDAKQGTWECYIIVNSDKRCS